MYHKRCVPPTKKEGFFSPFFSPIHKDPHESVSFVPGSCPRPSGSAALPSPAYSHTAGHFELDSNMSVQAKLLSCGLTNAITA